MSTADRAADARVRENAHRGATALGVRLPIVQAGMGGVATPGLAAAVCEAGALGTVALYKSDARQAGAAVRETATLTDAGFGVNVIPEVAGDRLDAQVSAVLAVADRRLVFNCYGPPPNGLVERVHRDGHTVLAQVGSVPALTAAVQQGVDVVALQGVEAGGHLLGDQPLDELVAAARAAEPGAPLLAAGGVGSGADTRRWLERGACGVLCGTAFVVAAESAAHPDYRAAVIGATGADTVVTDRFSIGWPGRRHRVLRSPVTERPDPPPARLVAWTTVTGSRLPVPCGSAAVPTLETDGSVDHLARYAGCGCGDLTAVEPAAVIVNRLAEGLADVPGSGRAGDRGDGPVTAPTAERVT